MATRGRGNDHGAAFADATPAYSAAVAEKGGIAAERRATPADAFRAAREIYMRGERIDMQALALQLGVSRGTLYRWTGSRERLLVDVVWSFADELFDWVQTKIQGRGAAVLAKRTDAYMHVLATSPALHAFLKQDQELAFRILTRRGVGVQERAVARLQADIEREEAKGEYTPPLKPYTLAYAILRVIEGFIYNDTIAGEEPDLKSAGKVVRALLGSPGG
ncbi:MAG: QsdR family transcriptional regulator [Thermoleophilaceae bacterium]